MTLTATTRACAACRTLLPTPPAPQVCGSCGNVAAPPVAEWPEGMRSWLVLEHARAAVEVGRLTEQQAWERLLTSVTRNRLPMVRADGSRGVVPWNITATDAFPWAVAAYERWCAKGKPKALTGQGDDR